MLFVLSKDKNTCVNASAQTDLYPKAEEKQEAQKYRIISNFGNTEICSWDNLRMPHIPFILQDTCYFLQEYMTGCWFHVWFEVWSVCPVWRAMFCCYWSTWARVLVEVEALLLSIHPSFCDIFANQMLANIQQDWRNKLMPRFIYFLLVQPVCWYNKVMAWKEVQTLLLITKVLHGDS